MTVEEDAKRERAAKARRTRRAGGPRTRRGEACVRSVRRRAAMRRDRRACAERPTTPSDEDARRSPSPDAARRATLRLRGVLRRARSRIAFISSKVARFRLAQAAELEAVDRRAARRDRDAARRRSSARGAALYYWYRTRARQLAEEVATEMSKVTWPSRTEVTNGTFVVIVTTIVSTVFFALMDKFWGFVTNLVYGGDAETSWPRSGTSSRPTRDTRTRSKKRSSSASRSTTWRTASARSSSPPRRSPSSAPAASRASRQKTSFPGYIFVEMEMSEDVWHLVKDTPKVTGFIGNQRPQEVTPPQIDDLRKSIVEGAVKPKPRVSFEAGDEIRVIDGAFANFSGTVEEVKPDKQKLRVKVSIFGRATPVELDFVRWRRGSRTRVASTTARARCGTRRSKGMSWRRKYRIVKLQLAGRQGQPGAARRARARPARHQHHGASARSSTPRRRGAT